MYIYFSRHLPGRLGQKGPDYGRERDARSHVPKEDLRTQQTPEGMITKLPFWPLLISEH